MNCSTCGNPLPEKAKFCAKCGTPVQDDPLAPVVAEPTVAEPTITEPTVTEPVVPAASETAPVVDPVMPVMPTFDIGPMMSDFADTGAIVPPSTKEKVKKSKSGGGNSYGGGGNGKKIALIAVAIILVLALLGTAAVFVLGLDSGLDFDDDDDDDRKSSSKDKDEDEDEDDHSLPVFGGEVDEDDDPKDKDDKDEEDGPKQEVTVEQETGLPAGNAYYQVYTSYTDFILPDSSEQFYKISDLDDMSYEELVVARQEIYARNGQTSLNTELQKYFDNRDWFQASNEPLALNHYEEANIYILGYLISQISDEPTPKTDNPYLPYLFSHAGMILSNSNSAYMGASELADLTETELEIAEFEIYARYGIFPSDTPLRIYFSCNPNFTYSGLEANFNENSLNAYEKNNLHLIRLYLRKERGITYTASNPFQAVDKDYGAYVIPYSSTQKLVSADYEYMTLPVLCIARNEILARHGYTFTDSELLEYFLSQDWYTPTTAPGDTSNLGLSAVENENVMAIKEYENYLKANGHTY